MRSDVFISYATEDKTDFVLPLFNELKKRRIKAWLDSENIEVGDSIAQKIQSALSECKFGLIVISENYIRKKWTINELDALFAREQVNKKVILPVLFGITLDQLTTKLPILSGRLFLDSKHGLLHIVDEIEKVLKDSELVRKRLYKMSYLEFNVGPESIGVNINFSEFSNYEKYDGRIYIDYAKKAANILKQIMAQMLGLNDEHLVLSRIKDDSYVHEVKGNVRSVVRYSFAVLRTEEQKNKWLSFSFMIHFRDWESLKNIDDNSCSLYININDKWDYDNYVEDNSSKAAKEFLTGLKGMLEEKICSLINVEDGMNAPRIIFSNPVYVKEAMPVWGANAFYYNGIIAE